MSWRDILRLNPSGKPPSPHLAKNPPGRADSADSADIASSYAVAKSDRNPIEEQPVTETRLEPEWIAQIMHNVQNPTRALNSAHCADSAPGDADSELDVSSYELMRRVFLSGGVLKLDQGRLIANRVPPNLDLSLQKHQPVILRVLRSVYEMAPNITPDLLAAIWMYSFNLKVLGDEQNKWENILFLADLARDHPEVIMRHCTEPPSYLNGTNRASKNVPSEG